MEQKNENLQELDPEQMEKVSGGSGDNGAPRRCANCGAIFTNYSKYVAHMAECSPQTKKFYRVDDIPR